MLSNGYLTVGWRDGDTLVYQAYSPQGGALDSNYVPHNADIVEAEIAALADGQLAKRPARPHERRCRQGPAPGPWRRRRPAGRRG